MARGYGHEVLGSSLPRRSILVDYKYPSWSPPLAQENAPRPIKLIVVPWAVAPQKLSIFPSV